MRTESRNDTSEFRVDQRTLVIFHEQSPARRARRRGGGAGVGPISGPTGPAECAALTRAERAACRRHLAGRRESQLRRPAGNCPDQSVPQGACGRGPDNQRTHVFTEVYLCVLSDCSTDCFRDRGWLQAARMAGSCTWCEVSPGDHELRSDVMTKIYSPCARASVRRVARKGGVVRLEVQTKRLELGQERVDNRKVGRNAVAGRGWGRWGMMKPKTVQAGLPLSGVGG